jgi:hypothetical protein
MFILNAFLMIDDPRLQIRCIGGKSGQIDHLNPEQSDQLNLLDFFKLSMLYFRAII